MTKKPAESPRRVTREGRLTRWERAKADSRGWRVASREAGAGAAGGVLAVAALFLFASKTSALQELIVVGSAILGAMVLVPAAEVAWNYIQAPLRIINDDLDAILVKLDALETKRASAPAPKKSVSVPLTLLDFIRKGEFISEQASETYRARPEVLAWTQVVTTFLAEHVSESACEQFLKAAKGNTLLGIQMMKRLDVLQELYDETQA